MARQHRVLVVEDDETLRETLGEVMADEGYEVRLAANGVEGLERLEEWDADLVILDLMMPLMDAYEFRTHQRGKGASTDAPVLLLSAARDIEEAARQLDAEAWLAKPFVLTDMLDTVDRLLLERAS